MLNLEISFRYYLERIGLKFRRRAFIFFDIVLPMDLQEPPESRVTIESIDLENFRAEYVIGWLSADQARHHLSSDDSKLFVAFYESNIVGNCWLENGLIKLNFLDFNEPLPQDSTYVTNLIVETKMRGLGIAKSLLKFACADAEKSGKNRIVICCDCDNSAVLNVINKMLWKKYLVVYYYRFIFIRFYFCRLVGSTKTAWTWWMNSRAVHIFQRGD